MKGTHLHFSFENSHIKLFINREMTQAEQDEFMEQFQEPVLEILGLTAVGKRHVNMCYGE